MLSTHPFFNRLLHHQAEQLHLKEEKAKGIQVAEWLVAQKVDVVLVKESLRGKGPAYVFRDAGIELRQTDANTLGKAIEAQ
ncbi:MAG: hypothetical protein ISS49_16580 [Anaerolineae bacterium]|nr:hypothetical protein [Anaerolineae bacterium]